MTKKYIRYSSRFILSYILGLTVSFPLGLALGAALDELGLGYRKAMACAILCAGLQFSLWSWLAAFQSQNWVRDSVQDRQSPTLDIKIYFTSFIFLFIGFLMIVISVARLLE